MGRAFDRSFPTALALGMDPSQYWDGDPWLVAAYREARRLADEERSWERWCMGMYVYDAVARTAPLLNAYSKRKQAYPWLDEPYEAGGRRRAAQGPQEAEQADHAAFADWLLAHGPRGR